MSRSPTSTEVSFFRRFGEWPATFGSSSQQDSRESGSPSQQDSRESGSPSSLRARLEQVDGRLLALVAAVVLLALRGRS